jgi:hypothetical protein
LAYALDVEVRSITKCLERGKTRGYVRPEASRADSRAGCAGDGEDDNLEAVHQLRRRDQRAAQQDAAQRAGFDVTLFLYRSNGVD